MVICELRFTRGEGGLIVVLFFLFFENVHESLQSFREVFVFVYSEFYSCFNASDVDVAEEKEDGEA